jgi:hypothetical protein
MWPISMRVNKPENDDPSILDPIAEHYIAGDEVAAHDSIQQGSEDGEAWVIGPPGVGDHWAECSPRALEFRMTMMSDITF